MKPGTVGRQSYRIAIVPGDGIGPEVIRQGGCGELRIILRHALSNALIPIVTGAGGLITTWDGGDAAKGGRIIAAGDRRVYDEARRLLAG